MSNVISSKTTATPKPSNNLPIIASGSGSSGVSTDYARWDHVHPMNQTMSQNTLKYINIDGPNNISLLEENIFDITIQSAFNDGYIKNATITMSSEENMSFVHMDSDYIGGYYNISTDISTLLFIHGNDKNILIKKSLDIGNNITYKNGYYSENKKIYNMIKTDTNNISTASECNIFDGCYNNIFVCCGLAKISSSYIPISLVSSNAKDWVVYKISDVGVSSLTPIYISHDGEKFIVASINGSVYTSTDGQNWIKIEAVNLPDKIDCIYYINSKYIASSASNFYYSTDLLTWETISSVLPSIVTSFAYDGTTLIASGVSGFKIYKSNDFGLSWSQQDVFPAYTSMGKSPSVYKIMYINNMYMYVTKDTCHCSFDGSTSWKLVDNFIPSNVDKICYTYNNKIFIFDNNKYFILEIKTTTEQEIPITISENKVDIDNFTKIEYFPSDSTKTPILMQNVNNKFIYSKYLNSCKIYWLSKNDNTNKLIEGGSVSFSSQYVYPHRIAYGNGVYVIRFSNNSICVSTDLNTFKSVGTENAYTDNLAYGNGYFINISTDCTTIRKSSDGINWEKSQLPENSRLSECGSIVYGNGKFIIFGGDRGEYLICGDGGDTWEKRTISNDPAIIEHFSGIVYFVNNRFIVISGDRISTIYASTDGINWTAYNTNIPIGVNNNTFATGYKDLLYGLGMYVLCVDKSSLYISFDLYNWIQLLYKTKYLESRDFYFSYFDGECLGFNAYDVYRNGIPKFVPLQTKIGVYFIPPTSNNLEVTLTLNAQDNYNISGQAVKKFKLNNEE